MLPVMVSESAIALRLSVFLKVFYPTRLK